MYTKELKLQVSATWCRSWWYLLKHYAGIVDRQYKYRCIVIYRFLQMLFYLSHICSVMSFVIYSQMFAVGGLVIVRRVSAMSA